MKKVKKVKKVKNGTLQKKKRNASSRESTKIKTRPGSTMNPRNEKVKGEYKVKKKGLTGTKPTSKGKVSTAKKNNKTKKELTLSALKKAPLGSNKRRALYSRLGYKQDHTTTGYKKAKSSVKKTGVKAVKPKSSKISTAKKIKSVSKAAKKVSATRAKGKAALASGNKAKALRMKKKEVRQTKRAVRKTKRATRRTKRK